MSLKKPDALMPTGLKPDTLTDLHFVSMQLFSQRDDTYEKCNQEHQEIVQEIFREIEKNFLTHRPTGEYGYSNYDKWQQLKQKYGGTE